MKRAYLVFECKDFNDEQRVIRGVATTATPDRMSDVVDPMGVKVAADIPLFLYHDSTKVVGRATFGKATAKGIPFEARLPKLTEPGALKDRVDEAWAMVRHGLITAVSIGFRVLQDGYEALKNGGLKYTATEVLELSLVPVPAQPEAVITGFKSMESDAQRAALIAHVISLDLQRAASGIKRSAVVTLPGASGEPTKPNPRGTEMKTIAEQIAAFEAQRDAKLKAMDAIMAKAGEAGTTLDDAQSEEYDTLQSEVDAIKKHLDRLVAHQKNVAAQAAPVRGNTQEEGTNSRGAPTILINRQPEEKFKGQFFTRKVIAKALAFLDQRSQTSVAMERWAKSHPQLVEIIKVNEVAGGSSDTWGSELVSADNRYTGDFIEYLYAQTVFDRLGLREVPANVAIKGQDGVATGYWTGESKAIKATTDDFSSVSLTPLKVAALAVVSNELLRDSTPAAEMLVRDALVQASAQRIDATFLSTTAASAGVSPAGILNGVTSIGSHGTDGDGLRNDIRALYAAFLSANNASGLSVVSNKSLAKAMQLMVNALGQPEFPGVTQNGGTLLGDTLVTGDNVGTGHLILLKPSDIYKIGDTGVRVEISRDATIEMATDPTGASDTPAGQTKQPVSMFQTESTAIKVVRAINFAKRRASAVQYIRDAAYGESAST